MNQFAYKFGITTKEYRENSGRGGGKRNGKKEEMETGKTIMIRIYPVLINRK